MRSIARVFGRSPFVPLQTHMEKVAECMSGLRDIFAAYGEGKAEEVAEFAKLISKREHEADLIKDEIRNSLPRGLFLPVDRVSLLKILSAQDDLADTAEDIAILLTFKQAKSPNSVQATFRLLLDKCLLAFDEVYSIIGQLDELLETGFGGAEAERVREMVDAVSKREYESDLLQRELLRDLFQHENDMSYGDFLLWTRIVTQVSLIADHADNLASSVHMTLEGK